MTRPSPCILAAGALLALSLAAPAQQPDPMTRLRDEKLALPVFQKAPWVFDYDRARALALRDGKPIFTYFSRSYAH